MKLRRGELRDAMFCDQGCHARFPGDYIHCDLDTSREAVHIL